MRAPTVAVVTTRGSPCRCGEAWTKAIRALGLQALPIAAEEASARRGLRTAAVAAFRALGLRDLARFDIRLTAEGPVFLEANVRPSVEPGLALTFAASLAGISWGELTLLSAARRHGVSDLLRRLDPAEL